MGLETGTYISDLVITNPVSTDGLAQADDHLRLIKSTIKTTFPSISGAVNATHTELNIIDGDTAATATTLVDADRMVINDNGTMAQVALSDLKTYLTSNLAITSAMITDGTIAEADIGDAQVTAAKLGADVVFLPTGCIIPFAGSTAPTGYLLCYGQAISRTTYADLFAALGTTYGTGDGSTTFNLPDLRGRVIAGQDDMGGSSADRLTNQTGGLDGDTLGATGGAETHTLDITEMPDHHHYIGSNSRVQVGLDNGTAYAGYSPTQYSATSTYTSNVRTTSNGTTTTDEAHNNVQPTIILNYIIKT